MRRSLGQHAGTTSSVALLALLALASCGDRSDVWNKPIGAPVSVGLDSFVALVDEPAHRVVLLSPSGPAGDPELSHSSLEIGHNMVAAVASPDKNRLFVLSKGEAPSKTDKGQAPRLSAIERGTGGALFQARTFPLATPLSGLAIDPLGRWLCIYAGAGASGQSFVENPNEIILVDLAEPDDNKAVVSRTLRSFGGRPQRITFSPALSLPGGVRRLLVVETEQDLSILDLDHVHDTVPRPEITVRLTNGTSSVALAPAGIVIDDGDPAKDDDARIGVRVQNDTNVITLTLARPSADAKPPNDFAPIINLTDVGGTASDIAFLRTDGGLRLAAIVPQTQNAVLIEPETSITTPVKLPGGLARISLITSIVGGAGDTALLYGGAASGGVAFWALGKTSGQPYRSVEVVSIPGEVQAVLDVPSPHAQLKVLQTGAQSFFVLDLVARTASPLSTLGAASFELSKDGERLWAFQKGTGNLASIALANLHPVPLPLDAAIDSVFEVANGGGAALIAVDARGGVGATVLDALHPDTALATARTYSGLFLEGL